MDEAIEFPLPGVTERRQILKMYLDSYIAKAGTTEGRECLMYHLHTLRDAGIARMQIHNIKMKCMHD